ncbi:MAG: YfhO family protein, partial [Clostridia bacterium]|nr:YfhO family protein [Clostridia bacterium]
MTAKKKNLLAENQYIFLAFIVTMGTMLIVFLCNQMVPFGDKTILRMDLYHQYGPLFAELYERIKHGDSLIYSWTSGLGSCFLGNYFNYLSSPLSALVMFFGHKNITEAIALMILLKASLSAATFTYYLKKSQHNQSFIGVCFGLLYAFSGYMLAYYWNVMWLDAMVLLPVVLYCIERIIDNGKIGIYVTALGLTMFSNYYMSFMICIFSCIYFFYYTVLKYDSSSVLDTEFKKDEKDLLKWFKNSRFFRSGCLFALGSLAAAGLLAIVLIPVYKILSECSATSGKFPEDLKTYFNYFDFLANHFASLTTTIRSSGEDVLPNIYCGVLPIILAPLYFFTKTISKKEKIATLGLLAVLYASFNLNWLNYIWHGFHFPNDLPYRQSFIYSFFLLLIAYKTFIRLREFKTVHIGVVGAVLLGFVVLVDEITSKNVTSTTVLFTLILVVLYVI